jgi:hypothetical protein
MLSIQSRLQIGKRVVRCQGSLATHASASSRLIQLTCMLVIVAIQAEQFPVAAIGRVVVMIVVLVMDRQLAQARTGKLAATSPTNPWEQFKCLLAISGCALIAVPACLGDNTVESRLIRGVCSCLLAQMRVKKRLVINAELMKYCTCTV